MSSLVRRIQRMPSRKKMIERKEEKKYLGYLGRRDKVGSKLGVKNDVK